MGRQAFWSACWLGVVALTAVAAGAEDTPLVTAEEGENASLLSADDGIPVVAAKDFALTAGAPDAATLERVEFLSDPPRVRLELSKPVSPIAGTRPAQAGKPPRVALNLPRSAVGASVPAVVPASGPVLRVRTKAIRPGVVQVVADLRQAMTYSVARNGTTITLALAPKPEPRTPPPAPAKPAPAKPAPVALATPGEAATAPAQETVKPAASQEAPTAAKAASQAAPPQSLEQLAANLRSVLASGGMAPAPAGAAPSRPSEIAQLAAEMKALEEGTAVPRRAGSAPAEAPTPVLEAKPLAAAPPAPTPQAVPLQPAAEPEAFAAVPGIDVTSVGGVAYVWPPTDAPYYADPEAAALRAEVERFRAGEPSPDSPLRMSHAPSTFYLNADVTFLRATAGRADMLAAVQAFERALRQWQDFPDAARALFVLGQIDLALGLGPEAGIAFAELIRRFPASPLVLDARLGLASSLRIRRRIAEARSLVDEVLAQARGNVLCRARREQAALAATPAAAVDAMKRLADTCPKALDDPRVLRAYADALVAAGEREAARALLTRRGPWSGDDGARLHLLAGVLAPDPDAARAEYERVLGMRVSREVVLEAEMRLALLDRNRNPQRAAATLAALAERPGPVGLRAAILGEAADTKARSGRFEEALALLERGHELGPEGTAQADGRRSEILGQWISTLNGRNDDAGIATVYAAYSTAVDRAATHDRASVARALSRLGLHASAARLLSASLGATPDAELAVEAVEETVASGDAAAAYAAVARVKAMTLPPVLGSRAHAAAARAALLAGDVDAAATEAAETSDLAARAQVARAALGRPGGAALASKLLKPALAPGAEAPFDALIAAGDASVAEGAFDTAEAAYRGALERATTAAERAAAGSKLARAARAGGDHATATGVLSELAQAGGDDPLIRRLATAAAQAGVRDVP
jgi:tetratricopeptide (TPR) repeat protein